MHLSTYLLLTTFPDVYIGALVNISATSKNSTKLAEVDGIEPPSFGSEPSVMPLYQTSIMRGKFLRACGTSHFQVSFGLIVIAPVKLTLKLVELRRIELLSRLCHSHVLPLNDSPVNLGPFGNSTHSLINRSISSVSNAHVTSHTRRIVI